MAAKGKLSVAAAKAARPEMKEYALRDEEVRGLVLRVHPSGRRTFAHSGKIVGTGKVVVTTIGEYGDITVAEARERAAEVRRHLLAGIDPRATARREQVEVQRQNNSMMLTFADVAGLPEYNPVTGIAKPGSYFALFREGRAVTSRKGRPKPRSVETEAGNLAHAVEIIGDEPVGAIGREAALRVKDETEGSDSLRRAVWDAAGRAMAHAVERGLAEINWFRQLVAPNRGSYRQRYLDPTEIKRAWVSAEKLNPAACDLFRFLISTPVRLGAAAHATWGQVSGDVLRLSDTKNNIPWPVPLTTIAQEILAACRPIDAGPDNLIFPSRGSRNRRGRGGPMSGWSDLKEDWDRASGLDDFRVHDLRRTMKSTLQNVRPDFDDSGSELWLQHRPTGIKGVYNAGVGLPAMRRVAAQWDEELRNILRMPTASDAAARIGR